MTKQADLEQLKADIVENDVCLELRKGATQLVMGAGNPNASIVFIGEAPGKQEDIQGLPFVGASGKFLNEMLAQTGLERSDVYITNIVKYRPPDNRDPTPDEKRDFWPYLMRQLEIIAPQVVITLGRHSMECFIPDAKISQQHGVPIRIRPYKNVTRPRGMDGVQGTDEQRTEVYEKYTEGAAESVTQQSAISDDSVTASDSEQVVASWLLVPLYHPAAALYNGSMRQTLIDDFVAAKAIADKELQRGA